LYVTPPFIKKARYLEKSHAAGKLRFHGELRKLSDAKNFARHLAPLRRSKWVVYARPLFGGPEKVLDYLGSRHAPGCHLNHRLKELKQGQVTFTYKDYQHGSQQKEMALRPMNSCGASCCMSFQTASSASAITGFLAIATVPRTWPLPGIVGHAGADPATAWRLPRALPTTQWSRSVALPTMQEWPHGANRLPVGSRPCSQV
jgi:hypothetical protein